MCAEKIQLMYSIKYLYFHNVFERVLSPVEMLQHVSFFDLLCYLHGCKIVKCISYQKITFLKLLKHATLTSKIRESAMIFLSEEFNKYSPRGQWVKGLLGQNTIISVML